MPTLDWLNRADAFTTAARVPYRLVVYREACRLGAARLALNWNAGRTALNGPHAQILSQVINRKARSA